MKPQSISGSKQPRVLMLGYTGANNTGAQALLQADIEDVQAVLGPNVHITIPTLNVVNLRRYVQESPTLTIVPMPMLFFGAIRRMVKECDFLLLVEGSTYMDSWGSPLLWLFLWATKCAADMGKPALAYAVDAGSLSAANQRRVQNIASRTGLIVTRNRAAAHRLRSIGVTAPIESTADNALIFQPYKSDRDWMFHNSLEKQTGIAGFAMVDFTCFPVIMRLLGSRKRCYKWPYFFSDSPRRKRSSEILSCGYAALADHIVECTGKRIAFICMEQLDETLAKQVFERMRHSKYALLYSSRQYDASKMTCLLRSLDILVTSRFHAAVLSLATGVPQIAIGHDDRLSMLYQDLGLKQQWFMRPSTANKPVWDICETDFFGGLRERVDLLLKNPALQKELLYQGHQMLLQRAHHNRELLADFVTRNLGHIVDYHLPPADLVDFKGGAAWAA